MARYIDAEALTLRLRLQFCKDCNNYKEIRCRSCDIDDTIDFIEDAHTADVVEVAHAKWKINCDGYYPYCSNCMTEPKSGVMSKYCPECGADMRGDK